MDGGFFQLDNEVHEVARECGHSAFVVLTYLVRLADQKGECFPSREAIAVEIGVSVESVKRAICKLVEFGILERKQVTPKGHAFKSNTYRILKFRIPESRDSPWVTSDPPRGSSVTRSVGHQRPALMTNTQVTNTHKTKKSQRKFSDDDLATAQWIFEAILRLNPKHRKPNFDCWANHVRLMRERDNRTDDEIRSVFAWANSDPFWHKNILGPDKLRKQFDKLTIQMKGNRNGQQQWSDSAKYDPNRPIGDL